MAVAHMPIMIDCLAGLASARPDAGGHGRIYYATDSGNFSRDTGADWETIRIDTARIVNGEIPLKAAPLASDDTVSAPSLASANTFTVAPQQITIDAAGNIGLIVKAKASQTADLQEWISSANAVLSRITKGGYFVTALHSAPADGDIAAGDCALWFDQTNGAGKLMVKAKTADGTVATGSITLT